MNNAVKRLCKTPKSEDRKGGPGLDPQYDFVIGGFWNAPSLIRDSYWSLPRGPDAAPLIGKFLAMLKTVVPKTPSSWNVTAALRYILQMYVGMS